MIKTKIYEIVNFCIFFLEFIKLLNFVLLLKNIGQKLNYVNNTLIKKARITSENA